MTDYASVSIIAAFFAGVISFLSPCVLPLVPGYLSYVTGGLSHNDGQSVLYIDRLKTVALSFCFVLGFSTIFILLGASASTIGQVVMGYRYELNIVGGAIVILFGLFILGIAQFNFMQREMRFHLSVPGGKPLAGYALGLAFGFGWTPCIGPILGAILTVSAATATIYEGVLLLSIYSLGLGIPFLLVALFTDAFSKKIKSASKLGRRLHQVSGVIMIIMGITMISGHLSAFSYWLLDTFPILGQIG